MPVYQNPVNGSKISEAYAESMSSTLLSRVDLATYEFRHPNFIDENGLPDPIRIVNDFVNITAKLEITAPSDADAYVEFEACPVDVKGPEEGDTNTTPVISITVDGVSGKIAEQLDLALLSPVSVTVIERIYMSDDLTGPARLPVVSMILRGTNVTDVTVAAQASFYDPSNNSFPRKEYIREEHPGLAAG